MEQIQYVDWPKQTGFVFAVESRYVKDNSTRTAFTYYSAPTVVKFIEWYVKQKGKHVHELIRPGYPARFFVDIDDKNKSADYEAFVKKLDDTCKALLRSTYNFADPQSFTLVAHREDKFSTHIIYENAVFSGAEQMYDFAYSLFDAIGRDKRMDMQLYSSTSPTRLRIAYSCSCGKTNPLVSPDKSLMPIDVLFRSLITALPKEPIFLSVSTFVMEREETNSACLSATERVVDWIKLMYTRDKVYSKTEENRCFLTIQPGLFCPVKKGMHATQSTFFVVTFLGESCAKGYFQCADLDCRKHKFPYKGNLTAVAFPKNIFSQSLNAKRIKEV